MNRYCGHLCRRSLRGMGRKGYCHSRLGHLLDNEYRFRSFGGTRGPVFAFFSLLFFPTFNLSSISFPRSPLSLNPSPSPLSHAPATDFSYPIRSSRSLSFFSQVSLQHLLPNFQECWFDHLFMDVFGANLIGCVIGMKLCEKLGLREVRKALFQLPTNFLSLFSLSHTISLLVSLSLSLSLSLSPLRSLCRSLSLSPSSLFLSHTLSKTFS